ncbi:glutamic acid-rich protein-like [Colletes gigas]|uniref:glutamic acid-rich protein-like n=1 Tax=Colletes gigas TaxID=935657 RepID=UPI001C9B769B|nr:glutamic acid-rich protein-like [Colletes gigas]
MRKDSYNVQKLESTKSMVVEAVIDNLHHKVFDRVTSRENIPEEYGTREELMVASTKVQLAFKEHLRTTRISKEGYLGLVKLDEEEYEEDEDEEEIETIEQGPDSEHHPLQSEAKSDMEYTEEQLTEAEAEVDEQEGTEYEIATEFLQTEPETEYFTELELEEETEGEGKPKN